MVATVSIQVQPGLIEDLLSPERLADNADAQRVLKKVATAEADNIMKGATYFNDLEAFVAVALAVAGYLSLEYEGHGALKDCHLTEEGRSLLAR